MAENVTSVAVEFGVKLDKFKKDLKDAGELSTQAQAQAVRMWIAEEKKRTKAAEKSARDRAKAEAKAAQDAAKAETRARKEAAKKRQDILEAARANARRFRDEQIAAHEAVLANEKRLQVGLAQTRQEFVRSIPVVGLFADELVEVPQELDEVDQEILDLNKSLRKQGMIFGAAAAAVTGAAAAYMDFRNRAHEARQEVIELNQTTGLLPETLAAIRLAGGPELLGKLGEAAGEAQKRIHDASRGTGEAQAAFKKFGIQLKDTEGNLRSTDEIVREYIEAVQAVESPTQQAADMTTLFGGAGRELNAALGAGQLDDWVSLTRDFGYDFGPRAIEGTKQWDTATGVLSAKLQNMIDKAGPGLDYLADVINGLGYSLTVTSAFMGASMMAPRAAMDAARKAGQQYIKALELTRNALEGVEGGGEGLPDAPKQAAKHAESLEDRLRAINAIEFKDIEISVDVIEGEAYSSFAGFMQDAARGFEVRPDLTFDFDQDDVTVTDSLFGPDFVNATAAASAALEKPIKAIDMLKAGVASAGETMDGLSGKLKMTSAVLRAHTEVGMQLLDNTMQLISENIDAYSWRAKRAVRALFKVQKGLAIANLVMSTAQASVAALAPPPIGLGPLAGIPLAALTAAAGATQIAVVAAQQPPTFHTGGMIGTPGPMPDEVGITALSGEGVVSRRGMAALDAINRGEGMSGGAPVIVYGARVFDAVQQDLATMPTSAISRAIRAKTRRRVGHRS